MGGFQPITLLLAICAYVSALFAVALWVERGSARARRWARSPYTYALALGVYCTSWTFYGSVGSAATEGSAFLTIYLGPTLAVILWGAFLRKMVRIKNVFRITSIADLISARYGKSQRLAALATVVAVVGTTPYIALQLRSVTSTFRVMASGIAAESSWLAPRVGGVVVGLMILFTILFGARRLDPTERHEGLMLALAAECLVKLFAFLAVGIFVTFVMHDGPGAIFSRLAEGAGRDFLQPRTPELAGAIGFCSLLLLSMSAIQFLPRQFHIAVVENSDERHVHTAAWLLPLYLFLSSLFVIPMGAAAVLAGVTGSQLDTVVLHFPLAAGVPWLSLLVFIGGFSAATGMIIVEALAVSTMITNHLLLPIFEATRRLNFLRRSLLRVRWAAIGLVLCAGYLFDLALGHAHSLASMGLISFAAVAQFAPAIVGGLYWRRGSGTGAAAGLAVGGAIWLYTLLLPALLGSLPTPPAFLREGLFGLASLRPWALFGLDGLHPVSHAVIWSLLFNGIAYVLGSLLSTPSEAEERIATGFVDILKISPARRPVWVEDEASVSLATKSTMIDGLLRRYFDSEHAAEIRLRCEATLALGREDKISVGALAALYGEIERVLAGSIGAAAAHQAVRQQLVYTPEEASELPRVYGRILANLKVSPGDLKRRVDYYQERAAFLEAQAAQLEASVEARTAELKESNAKLQGEVHERQRAQQELSRSNAELEQFAYVASHDLQEPLRMVASYLQLIERRYKDKLDSDGNDFIGFAVDGAKRMQSLISDLLLFARIGTRGKAFVNTDCAKLLETIQLDLRIAIADSGARLTIGPLPTVLGDDLQLRQLFANLVGNALKFRGASPPDVRINAERQDGEWRFSVTDNGIGIERRYFEQIFRLFHRLHTRAAYPGNGIGLSLCKKIVERHGGRIWVESQTGHGTTFTFTIPDQRALA